MRYTLLEEFYPGTCINVTHLYTLWRRFMHVCLKGRARLPHSHCSLSRKYALSVTTISSDQLYISHPCYFYSCNNTHYNGGDWFQSLFSVFDLRLGEPLTPNDGSGPRNLWHIQLEWKHLPLTPIWKHRQCSASSHLSCQQDTLICKNPSIPLVMPLNTFVGSR